jgi:hypothetical protein
MLEHFDCVRMLYFLCLIRRFLFSCFLNVEVIASRLRCLGFLFCLYVYPFH